jgi:GMP synthase (glutamine-hydrolysing)
MTGAAVSECLAIRHVAFEDAGLIRGLVTARGMQLRYLDAGVEPIDEATLLAPDLVVILGGPIGVYEADRYPFLNAEFAAVRARLDAGKPTLGICLGAQIIARAMGANVAPGPRKELGYAPVTLSEAGRASVLAGLEGVPVLHWHGDNAELPAGAVHLAATSVCPNQAFAIGKAILALQFHIEAEPPRLEQWLVGHAAELAKAGIDPRELRRAGAEFGPRTAEIGRAVLSAWLDRVLGSA